MDKLLLHFFFISLLFPFAHLKPILSCSETPYPHTCTSITSATRINRYKSTPLNFRNLVIKATMDHAARILHLASSTNSNSFGLRTETAWLDCLDLYQETILLLNTTLSSYSPYEDSQTWLSAAIANQETCENGFVELASSSKFQSSPFSSSNVLESISNTLAINAAMKARTNRKLLSSGVFPHWLSVHDRKLLQSSNVKADIVVAKDGSGNYRSINEAVAASSKMRKGGSSRFVIHVKAGVYKENVEVKKSMKNLMILGDGIDKTIVSGSKNVHDGSTTFRSATFAVTGERFIARDITFENTAGAEKHQAVALRSGSDLSVFYRCSFKGYQDTLYVHSNRQFYRSCHVYGTIDFIFGDAATVLQDCKIYVRKPLPNQENTVTAQGRRDKNENTGIVIHQSMILPASDLKPVQSMYRSYLGRPWKEYSRTVIMKTYIGGFIDPKGWLEWSGSFGLNTLYYGEYDNKGAGANTSRRVKWPGFHVMNKAQAERFTVQNFLMGNSWIPASGVPYTAGL